MFGSLAVAALLLVGMTAIEASKVVAGNGLVTTALTSRQSPSEATAAAQGGKLVATNTSAPVTIRQQPTIPRPRPV